MYPCFENLVITDPVGFKTDLKSQVVETIFSIDACHKAKRVMKNSSQITTRFSFSSIFLLVLGILLLGSCQKHDSHVTADEEVTGADASDLATDQAMVNCYNTLQFRTLHELLEARAATAKYQHIDKALDDGYADINVVMPNMGYHFLKSAILDSKFEVKKPELLVYNKDRYGKFQLVAVEYAVPIDSMPDGPPMGFTGFGDVWDRNTTFNLWTLHAWVWKNNPAGVFHPTNPLVHVR